MAYYDVARSKAAYDYAVIFRGTFDSGAAIAWATRHIKTSSGLVEGRMEIAGQIVSGLSEISGGAFQLPSLTIKLHNHDGAITKYLVGTTSVSPSTEYRSDGLLNLRGKFYHAVRDPADGSIHEQAITPTMAVSGSVEYDGFTATLAMQARADYIGGRSVYGFRVRDLVASSSGAFADGTRYDVAGNSAFSHAQFDALMLGATKNLDARVPYLYGANVFPLIPIGEAAANRFYLAGVTFREPSLSSSFTMPIFFERRDQRVPFHENLLATEYAGRGILYVIKRAVTTPDGETANVWVMLVQLFLAREGDFFFESPSPRLGVQDNPPTTPDNWGPAGLIRALIIDHSEAGAAAVDTTSFQRASWAMLWSPYGGTYFGDALAPEITAICRAAGLSMWLGKDDKLRIAFNRSFNADDLATIAAGLTHITHADILDGWQESVPWDGPEQLGAPVSRVVIEWTDEQQKFWGAELPLYTAGATSLPMAEIREGNIPGGWIYPHHAIAATQENATRRAFVNRRIEFVGRAWLATVEPGTLFWLSHPRGLSNEGSGYALRVVRLENIEYTPGEDGCRCRFEDLGPQAARKLGKLDTIANWVKATPTAGANTLTVANGSPNVTSSAPIFTADMVGCHLWTQGAANRDNAGSRKITGYTSATQVTVERNFGTNEAIAAAGSGWGAAWLVMDTQASKGSSYRSDRIRNCVETTGLFRDGTTAGFEFSLD